MKMIWSVARVAVLLLVLVGTPMAVSAATGARGDAAASARADDIKDKNKDASEGDHDRGHGNDPDGVDEDNPGRGKKDKKNDPAAAPVEVTAQYRVDLSCKPKGKDGGETSTCEFRAVAPEGEEKANRVIVPADAVCVDVVGGDYEQVEVRSGEGLNGYASKPDKDEVHAGAGRRGDNRRHDDLLDRHGTWTLPGRRAGAGVRRRGGTGSPGIDATPGLNAHAGNRLARRGRRDLRRCPGGHDRVRLVRSLPAGWERR